MLYPQLTGHAQLMVMIISTDALPASAHPTRAVPKWNLTH